MISKSLNKIIKNPNVIYILNKYSVFVFSFVSSILIALKLGAFHLGIWGFINLVISYLTYTSFGIPNSLNIIVSKNKYEKEYSQKIYWNSNGLISIIILLLIIVFTAINYGDVELGTKYNFADYSHFIFGVVIFGLINGNLSVLLRIYNKVNLISLTQSFYPIFAFIAVLICDSSILLDVLVLILFLSNFFTTILYIIFSPFKFRIKYNWELMKLIQGKGVFLFAYNACFYFIMLSTKSFVSKNYLVEEFGFFTFSFSFANAVLLLMSTLSFLIFPKMIALLSSKDNSIVSQTLVKLRANYIVLSHLLIHVAIFSFPFFINFFPQYANTLVSFQLIGLTLIMYSNAFGYQGLLMARDKEKILSLTSFGALILNVILAFVLTQVFHVGFSYVILCTLITYFVYVSVLTYMGRKTLQLDSGFWQVMKDAHHSKIFIPYAVSLAFVMIHTSVIYFLVPLILFVVLNRKDLIIIYESGIKLIKSPEVLNI